MRRPKTEPPREWHVYRTATAPHRGAQGSAAPDLVLPHKPGEPGSFAGRRAVKALGWHGLRYVVFSETSASFYIYPGRGRPAIAWGVLTNKTLEGDPQ